MFLRRMVAVFATLSVLLAPGALTAQDDGQPEGRIRALVIGNVGYDPSKYQVIQWKPLVGAYNDAVMITQKLLDEGVSRDAITLLTDPPSAELREQKRGLELFETDLVPDGIGTRDNILGALKQLALTTRPGDEVLITFSGHGYQQREMVAGNEPDGLDEIFIPLDVRDPAPGDSEKRLPGAITDDEIGAAIDAIRAKGGNVTYLADYCHSGDSMRNAGEDSDLPPAGLLAEPKFADIGDGDFVQDLAVEASKGKPGWGSFVAMMAAPSAIQAKQERAPGFWPRDEQKTLGILTAYSFANLSNPQVVTYRDLAARVGSNFSEYEKKAPRPLFDGDLDRPILGGLLKSASDERRDSWLVNKPRRDLKAETMAVASLEMSAGAFQGVTEGTIIALSSVRGEGEKVLLYGQVASTTAFTAKLVPVSFNGIDAAQWQDIRDADGDRFSREAKLIATVAQRPVDVSFRVARPAPPSNPTPAQKVALEWFAKTEPGPLGATFVAPGEEAELAFRLDGDRLAMEEAGTRVTDYGTMDLGELIARGGEDEVAGVLGPAIVRAARFHKLRKVLASNDGLGTQEDNPAEKVAIRFHLLRQDDPVDAEGNCRVPPDAGLGREQLRDLRRADLPQMRHPDGRDRERLERGNLRQPALFHLLGGDLLARGAARSHRYALSARAEGHVPHPVRQGDGSPAAAGRVDRAGVRSGRRHRGQLRSARPGPGARGGFRTRGANRRHDTRRLHPAFGPVARDRGRGHHRLDLRRSLALGHGGQGVGDGRSAV